MDFCCIVDGHNDHLEIKKKDIIEKFTNFLHPTQISLITYSLLMISLNRVVLMWVEECLKFLKFKTLH